MLLQTSDGTVGPVDAGDGAPLLLCDLTQSYAPKGGGGISTYLREKRDHVLANTPHSLLQIVPGPRDRLTVSGRHIFAEVGADSVRGSPNYRFILRTRAVRSLLEQYRPAIIESLCPWVLPWTAIRHRRAFPETVLVAGYRTDFPNAHIYRVGKRWFGDPVARGLRWISMGYAEVTYREFDLVYTLNEEARGRLGTRGIDHSAVLPLGVDTTRFHPDRRDPGYRRELGLPGDGPLLIYAGRIDHEKRADCLLGMMRCLPRDLGAALVMVGDGKLRQPLEAAARAEGLPVAFPGYEQDRAGLARALASSDLYVSAMADETFGVSVLEAQASALPVIGVASGAMIDRVPPGLGLLGPVDDAKAMAGHVVRLWQSDFRAIGHAARDMVERHYGWRATFDRLLDDLYPMAFAHAARRRAGAGGRWFARTARPVGLQAFGSERVG